LILCAITVDVLSATRIVSDRSLGSTVCVGQTRLRDALARMRAEGHGAAVYHRHPGAGLGSCGCATGADEHAPLDCTTGEPEESA
jgi:hypothetical protein